MSNWAELYLNRLDEMAGLEAQHYRVSPPEISPPISVVQYMDDTTPQAQFGFTVGLSAYEHNDWKLSRPELCISVNSADFLWSFAIGEIADRLKGSCPFCYGDIVRFGGFISDESEMSAFIVFAPSFIAKENIKIEVPNWTISLAQMYPIYDEEIEWIEKVGMKELFSRPGSFFEDPNRKSLAK